MKKLIVITAFVLLGMLANSVQATLFTGCISPGGDLKNVAEGPEPSKPCGKNDTMTQWEEPEEEPPASICPCNIESTASWAGWAGPECFEEVNIPLSRVTLRVRSTDINNSPSAKVLGTFTNDGFITSCEIFSEAGSSFEDFDLTDEEFLACNEDLNELAITLGLFDGCTLTPQ
jgi:hypothetical protein